MRLSLSHIVLSIILLTSIQISLFSQSVINITGHIADENMKPLPGATVILNKNKTVVTDNNGFFYFIIEKDGISQVEARFIGYKTWYKAISPVSDTILNINMEEETEQLGEVIIRLNQTEESEKESPFSMMIIGNDYLKSNMSGSLMQTLSKLPGISAIEIGSSQSKPVIRGLGFSRVVVAEQGIKHEGQEWGSDHGLEIDQNGIEQIEIVRGPASLIYGSGAIGGVIDIKRVKLPAAHSTGGSIGLNFKTNNNNIGVSALVYSRGGKTYFKNRISYSIYEDYKVPADSIEYMSYYFRLKDHFLRNTSGRDFNESFTAGYISGGFSTHISFSDTFMRSGFFANAHGLEIRTSGINYDRSARDIDLPYQQVNHVKIISNTEWIKENSRLYLDLAFQNNDRKEFSEPVSHGYMPEPPDSLERVFNKNIVTSNVKYVFNFAKGHSATAGINIESQSNRSGGWSFILPDFHSALTGFYLLDKISFSDNLIITAGIRYDHGKINTDSYYDWYVTPGENSTPSYLQRAYNIERDFNTISWAAGLFYNNRGFTIKINTGKSFRIPDPNELAANGINYHMFRFERGDSSLHAETSYQVDLELEWKQEDLTLSISPFVNYFPNYIYLNPTSDYYEGLQIYYHRESRVFRSGGELSATYGLTGFLTLGSDIEYVRSLQLSGEKKGFTLPFSPPASAAFRLNFTPKDRIYFHGTEIILEYKLTGAQNEIVPPEKKTEGHSLFNMSFSTTINSFKSDLRLQFMLHNIFNRRYLDHTSYYRLIEVPGAGRNFVFSLELPIGKKQ